MKGENNMLRPIVLWIVALIMIFISLKNIIIRAIKIKRCTEEVTAKITKITEKRRTPGGSPAMGSMEYIPTVAYTVDGTEYIANYMKSSSDTAYEVGGSIDIMINPNNPGEINNKGLSNTADLITLGFGAVVAVAGVLVLIFQ